MYAFRDHNNTTFVFKPENPAKFVTGVAIAFFLQEFKIDMALQDLDKNVVQGQRAVFSTTVVGQLNTKAVDVLDDATLRSSLNVDGKVDIGNDADVNGDLLIGGNLTVAGTITGTLLPLLTGGTYTATLTAGVGVTGVTQSPTLLYTRFGDIVQVNGAIQFAIGAVAQGTLYVSLPVESTFTASGDLVGAGTGSKALASTELADLSATADTAGDANRATVLCNVSASGADTVNGTINFAYSIK